VATLLNDVKNRFASVDLALLSFRQSTQERKKSKSWCWWYISWSFFCLLNYL